MNTLARAPQELGIMYSRTCNIECRHCGIMSGPKNKEKMSFELAKSCIRQASEIGNGLDTVIFTGGEPFVHVADLERLVGFCNDLGLSARVVTNGFWAKNVERGRDILWRLRIAGLDTINFSADKYHLEHQDPKVLRNAIDIAREVGLVVIINFTVNTPGDPADEMAKLYGLERKDIRLFYDDEELRNLIADPNTSADVFDKIHLHPGRLVGLGRSAQYPEEHFLSPAGAFIYSPCAEIANRPIIYPNGDLQACCCAGGTVGEFLIGNVHQYALSQLFDAMMERSHFRFINTFGPHQLFDVMRKHRQDHTMPDPLASICDMCVAATSGMDGQDIDTVLEHWLLSKWMNTATPKAG